MTTPGSNIPSNEQAHASGAREGLLSETETETSRRIQATNSVNNTMNEQPASLSRADVNVSYEQRPASLRRADVSDSNQQQCAQQPTSLASVRNAVAELRDDVQRTIETLQAALGVIIFRLGVSCSQKNDDDGSTDEEETDVYDLFMSDEDDDFDNNENDAGAEAEVQEGNEVNNENEYDNNGNDTGVEAEVQQGNEVLPVVPVQTNQPHASTSLPLPQEGFGNLNEAMRIYAELSARYDRFLQGLQENGFPNKRGKGLNGVVISASLTKKVHEPSPGIEPPCCSICLDDFQAGELLGILECTHSYHHVCIEGWLQRDNSCPLCRTKGVTI